MNCRYCGAKSNRHQAGCTRPRRKKKAKADVGKGIQESKPIPPGILGTPVHIPPGFDGSNGDVGNSRPGIPRRIAMATLIAGQHDWLIYSDRGTLLGFGRTRGEALEKAQRHPRIIELGADVVLRK